MQSGGYGGVSHEIHQQFMVDGSCPPSLFSTPAQPNPNSPSSADIHAAHRYHHPLSHHHHHHHHQQPQPPHFAHFGPPIPITQQLFQHAANQHHHPQFQFFHQYQHQHQHQHQHQQQHLGLEQEASGPESADGPPGPTSFLAAMNFKLGVNESSGGGGGSRDALDDDDGSESRLHLHHHHPHHHPWHRDSEDQSAAAAANIKEPFWRPLDIDYINPNNKRPASSSAKDKQQPAEISSKHFKKSNNNEINVEHNHNQTSGNAAAATTNSSNQTGDSNYKLFSELEAIYKPNEHVQTGSGSALTGDDNSALMPPAAAAAAAAAAAVDPGPTFDTIQPDNISNSTSKVTPPVLATDDKYDKAGASSSGGGGGGGSRRKSKKKRQQKQLAAIATFFESLVKQLMEHQESLHRRFLEVMEKRDQERSSREEAWRKQEAARASREAAARAQERALAASREAAIISFLEKITGESLKLPAEKPHDQFVVDEGPNLQQHQDNHAAAIDQVDCSFGSGGVGSSRWPKAEVQALIRVRSGFESRFQEPGLKSPLWEEVSHAMAKLGYSRSAKRCKEKWENINKYFRKTKDSGKKRPQHSKTCPYFHQLDQLYSRPNSSNAAAGSERKEMPAANSELLDAIVDPKEPAGKRTYNNNNTDPSAGDNDDDDDNDQQYNHEDGDDEEEGQGESQDQAQDRSSM